MDLDGKEIYRMRIRNNYATKDSGLTDDMTLAAASANAGENMRKRKLEKMLEEVTCTKMAAGMVHHMEKKLESTSVPSSVKDCVRRTFTAGAKSAGLKKNDVKKITGEVALFMPTSKTDTLVHVRRGRPVGTPTIDYDSVDGILRKNSTETCRMHLRCGAPQMSVNESQRAMLHKDPVLNTLISKTTLAKHCKSAYTPWCKGHQQLDKCAVCLIWDKSAEKKLRAETGKYIEAFKKNIPVFFDELTSVSIDSLQMDNHNDLRRVGEYVQNKLVITFRFSLEDSASQK